MMPRVDFLIIGQGLAGSLLAYSLIKRGKSVMVLDNQHRGCATQVAAGLINPVTGHRLNITDNFFTYLQYAKKLYWQIERDLGCTVYHPLKQTRLIKNAGQAEYLQKRTSQVEYQSILDNINDTGDWFDDQEQFPYGAINVSSTAMIDTSLLLYAINQWLQQRSFIRQQQVQYSDLKRCNDGFEYQQIRAGNVVFCEGFQATKNPWLEQLPFKLAKGEILTITTSQPVDRMLSWGNWLVPMNNGKAKLGSNYIWNNTTLNPSDDAQKLFIDSLHKHTSLNATVDAHDVGIRPSTVQRKPFVGPLSNLDGAYCLNGLGSKGCLISPYYVDLLCQHLLTDQPLPEEVTQWL